MTTNALRSSKSIMAFIIVVAPDQNGGVLWENQFSTSTSMLKSQKLPSHGSLILYTTSFPPGTSAVAILIQPRNADE